MNRKQFFVVERGCDKKLVIVPGITIVELWISKIIEENVCGIHTSELGTIYLQKKPPESPPGGPVVIYIWVEEL